MTDHPRTTADRADLRADLRADGRERGERGAVLAYSSIKCGEYGLHADAPDGCANDGAGCLCECHDDHPAPAEMLRRAAAVARNVPTRGLL